ncbi:hypothetical protein T4B_7955 [Trichinella pseudospiralis]|uniref:Uncharacterized protein n=1 Tax=Trichinella pseudospiralis TaxID=6337 RepID=A0A0V1HWS7_TRIPS|nr:hypothetical protein T4A_2335 [Trichinella pseudospiralis]KRZ14815.1 hypothetical protein T4B_7955 [Trichinella pseudospiralis]KRZ25987.1 hypothetical protein T4C_13145 [Trichinella pseudospiralis]
MENISMGHLLAVKSGEKATACCEEFCSEQKLEQDKEQISNFIDLIRFSGSFVKKRKPDKQFSHLWVA